MIEWLMPEESVKILNNENIEKEKYVCSSSLKSPHVEHYHLHHYHHHHHLLICVYSSKEPLSQIEVAVVFQLHGDFDGSKIQQSY